MHMHYLRFRSYRALILGALGGCVVLAACQPASTAPAAVAPSPAAVLAPSPLGLPTAIPATVATNGTLTSPATATVAGVPSLPPTTTNPPSALPYTTPTASEPSQSRSTSPSIARLSPFEIDRLTAVALATASSVPAAPSPTPLPQAASLPLDQPWFLIADEYTDCGTDIPASRLVTIDRSGQWTQLDRRITAVAERPGAPPLLATCAV